MKWENNMRFLWIINPGAHRRNKYQGKIAKAQWKQMRGQSHTVTAEFSGRSRAEARTALVTRWKALTRAQKVIVASSAGVLIVILAVVGGHQPSAAAPSSTSYPLCKQIMIQKATLLGSVAGAASGGLPDACSGLSQAQMAKIDTSVRAAVKANG